jgi:hypothetical protein
MTTTAAPFGLRPVYHPSGVIRQTEYLNGVASGYASNIFTGSPVKYTTDGTLILTPAGASDTVGTFAGCEFSSATRYFVLPYWPASQTYDSAGPARFYINDDKNIIYEGQANGSVAQTANREGINLVGAVSGSTYTGQSTQALNATTTGATAATFIVTDVAPYEGNVWGDAFTIVRVAIATYSGQIA